MNATQKKNRIARAVFHAEQDRLIAGTYIKLNGKPKGCSVGCDLIDIELERGIELDQITDDDCHLKVAEHDGTPEWLERLRDTIFEGLPESDRIWWHVELAKSLPTWDDSKGTVDPRWKPYFHKICKSILTSALENKACWQDPYSESVCSAINLTINYHDNPAESALSAALSARSAARSALSASLSALSAAESAARSAALSARSARSAAYKRFATSVIEIFGKC